MTNNVYKKVNYKIEEFKDFSSGTTIFPNNVKPINTFGDVYMTLTYKPVSFRSIIIVKAIGSMSSLVGSLFVSGALFVNSELYSKGAQTVNAPVTGMTKSVIFYSKITNFTGDELNLYARFGGNNGGATFNQRLGGHDTSSSIKVYEYMIL